MSFKSKSIGNPRKRRAGLVALFSAAAVVFAAAGGLANFSQAKADILETQTQAVFLGMDKDTKGNWYDAASAPEGEKASYLNTTALYGSEGVMMTYQKITGDGQPVTDVTQINDFTEESPVNYVKYPSYVESIEGDIKSTRDTPHGYWNYNEAGVQAGAHGSLSKAALLSPEPAVWSSKDVMQLTRDDINYTVTVNDDLYHKVSIYLGFMNQSQSNAYQYLRIMDTDSNVLSTVLCNDFGDGIYYSFAVKGSFIINVKQISGTVQAMLNAFFFDPMLDAEADAANQKKDVSATLKGAREVTLSWTNPQPSKTAIYRKIKGQPDSAYEQIAYLKDKNATSYTDTTAKVAKKYTYLLGSGLSRKGYASVTDYVVPKSSVDIATAEYALTSVEFDKPKYTLNAVNEEVTLTVTVRKNVIYDEDENIVQAGEPYANTQVRIELDGALVYDTVGDVKPNMDPVMGTVTTDAQGKATLTFTPPYAGEYELVAIVEVYSDPADETKGFDGCEGRADFSVKIAGWTAAPVIATVSDAIAPGESFAVMGTGLIPDDEAKVAIAPASGTVDPAFDKNASGLRYLTPVFTDGEYDSGVMLKLPADCAPGLYNVWVSNRYGWSRGFTMNAARPLFLSQEASYAGLEIEVVGRNYFVDEFGMAEAGRSNIKIKLVRTGDETGAADGKTEEILLSPKTGIRYTAAESVTGKAVDESNPYRLTFETPAVKEYGTYAVYVANDGVHFRTLDNGQKLVLKAKKQGDANASLFGESSGYDPLGLGVYWAQDLHYDNVERMKAAEGRDDKDDTLSIQSKIDALSGAGGGIVFFPNGTYIVERLEMASNVILLGQSMEQTVFEVNQKVSTEGYFIRNSGSNNGIARLTIRLRQGSCVPDMYLNFADSPDSSSDVDLRVHSNVFIKNVKMDFPYDVQDPNGNSGSNRGLGILLSGNKNFVIDDNSITGYFAVLHRGFVNKYVSIRNNVFKVQRDVMHCLASFAFIENTALLGNNNDGHGWSARSDCYFGNNLISKVGLEYPKANNNGEIIMLEVPGAQLNYGSVLGADAEKRTVTVDRLCGIPMTTADYNYFAMLISDGAGMGQIRYIERNAVSGDADSNLNYGNTFRLREGQRDWDVLPDQTSQYVIYIPQEHATIYRNKAEHCAKSILLYSQCADALVAENELKDTEGISVYSTVGNTGTKGTNFFIRVERNSVEGVSVMTAKGGIGVMSERWTEKSVYGGMLSGGVSIRYNTVKNTPGGEYVSMSEVPATHGIYIHTKGVENVVEQVGDIRFTIVEGNTVDTSEYGVYIDNRAYCTIITRNTFRNIEASEDVTNIGASDLSISSELKFELNGGTMSGAADGIYLMNDVLPAAEKEGYAFWGWATSTAPSADAEAIVYAPSSSGTLYAIYGFKVELIYNCEGKDVYRTLVAREGLSCGTLPSPIRTGYDFGGWYLDAACTQAYDTASQVKGSVRLYAKWTKEGGQNSSTPAPSSGCGSFMAGQGITIGALLVCAAVLTLSMKRRKE